MKNRTLIAMLLPILFFTVNAHSADFGENGNQGEGGGDFGDRFDDVFSPGPGNGPVENPSNPNPFDPVGGGPAFPDPASVGPTPVLPDPGAGVPIFEPQPQSPGLIEPGGGFNPGSQAPLFEPAGGAVSQTAALQQSGSESGGSVMSRYITGDYNSPAAFGVAEATGAPAPQSGAASAGNGSAESSFVFIVTGKVVSLDPSTNAVVIKDKSSHKNKTVYVDAQTMGKIKKGNIIQTSVRPGTNRAENLKQIVG